MTSTTNAEIAKADGDLRIALLLGIANWFLFLDHIPHNVVGALTMRNFGFSGATDLFVFVGGYAVTLIYARMTLERGFLVAATRIFKRVWQLYAAYIVLFVIYVELISYVATRTAAPEIISEFNITGFIDHPIRTLIYGLFLQAKPLNLDVLQLTIALMAFQPIIVFGLLYVPNATVVASVTLYAAGRLLDWNLSSYPYGDWYLNPFCWQLLFMMGGWLALIGARYAPAIRAMQAAPALRAMALLYLLFALTIVSSSDIPALAQMMPSGLSDVLLPNDREDVAPHRILHFLVLTFLFSWLVPRDWDYLRSHALQPIIKCGEEWLAVFCAGVFLSFAAHLILITGPYSLARQVAVSIAGIAAMTAVAYYVSWSKQQDGKSAVAHS
ncbi:OpgC domain-containing protein [Bradyrhizobium pachyrhizi]|uniref:OpgC domain-containing protein n=1 Tax=Bradyrhizobium pachyrhizi TaxID=280333 RepID=A0A844SJM7_9BRAD|nr:MULTISPECIES: OpgC domain-containing protein [Bradyrhizobium]MVT67198.1 OpgC domain-containing protein [Bradyrhizobium pachyrhizi]WFU53901.1 OpgC domain-containing protein [Bradyrhizobium pachyrhizi]WOH79596.1 OpgC domain-containing protein [Bradyrhizobium sp. BEA-2-5]